MKEKIISFFVMLFSLFPSPVRWFLWDMFRNYGQKPFLLIRYAIAKNELGECGDNVYFGVNVTIKNRKKIKIGSNVSIHDNCYIDGYGGLTIGNNVSIAHASSILTTNHTWDDKDTPIKYNLASSGAVYIADDVWIGCGVRVLASSKIQKRTVVAASAVLTGGEYAGKHIYAGIPAKKVKAI